MHDDELVALDYRTDTAEVEQEPAARKDRQFGLLPKIAAADTATAHRNVPQWELSRRGRRQHLDSPVEGCIFAAVDQRIDCHRGLNGEALHAGHGLGEEPAVYDKFRLHGAIHLPSADCKIRQIGSRFG